MASGSSRDKAKACVDRAFDLGINFIDTANVYGRGAAERFLGEALSGRARDSYVLATKLWGDMGNGDKGLSRGQIEKQIDASLARLKTDHVDLYQCHRYDPDTPLEETMQALSDVVKAGKARYIGFSEWAPDQIEASLTLSKEMGLEKFVSSQPQYSLLYRRPEKKVIPICAAGGVSQIVWSAAGAGGAHRQVRSRPAAACEHPRQLRSDGRFHLTLDGETDFAGGADAEAPRG